MGDVVNLRRVRKGKERERKEAEAAQNRLAFGTTGAERRRIEGAKEKSERSLEGHRLVRPDES